MGTDVRDAERDPRYLEWLRAVAHAKLGSADATGSVGLHRTEALRGKGDELLVLLHHSTGDAFLAQPCGTFSALLADTLAGARAKVDGRWRDAAAIHDEFVRAHGEVASIEFIRGMGGEFVRLVAADGTAVIASES